MSFFKRIKFPEAVHESEVRPPSGPRSAGHALRQRREQLGLSLDQAGGALKIKPAYLAALEEGRPDRLPGPAYAVGFLKSYGEHLGLDGGEVVRRFKAESAGLDTKPDLSFPMPLGERGVPGGGTLLVALILVACGYGAWYYLSTGERLRPQRVSALPAALVPAPPPRAAAAPGPSPPPAALPAPGASAAVTPPAAEVPPPDAGPTATALAVPHPAVPPPMVTPPVVPRPLVPAPAVPSPGAAKAAAEPAAKSPPAQLQTAAAVAAPAAPAGKAPAAENPAPGGEASRILIRATADSWIEVHDTAGAVLFTRVLKAGDTYQVPAKPGLTLDTGNAGGLALSLDGKALPSLGDAGAVRRRIALDPTALAAAKPKAD